MRARKGAIRKSPKGLKSPKETASQRRFSLNHRQRAILLEEYRRKKQPSQETCRRLAEKVGHMEPSQVRVWFQNMRAKERKMGIFEEPVEDDNMNNLSASLRASFTPKDWKECEDPKQKEMAKKRASQRRYYARQKIRERFVGAIQSWKNGVLPTPLPFSSPSPSFGVQYNKGGRRASWMGMAEFEEQSDYDTQSSTSGMSPKAFPPTPLGVAHNDAIQIDTDMNLHIEVHGSWMSTASSTAASGFQEPSWPPSFIPAMEHIPMSSTSIGGCSQTGAVRPYPATVFHNEAQVKTRESSAPTNGLQEPFNLSTFNPYVDYSLLIDEYASLNRRKHFAPTSSSNIDENNELPAMEEADVEDKYLHQNNPFNHPSVVLNDSFVPDLSSLQLVDNGSQPSMHPFNNCIVGGLQMGLQAQDCWEDGCMGFMDSPMSSNSFSDTFGTWSDGNGTYADLGNDCFWVEKLLPRSF